MKEIILDARSHSENDTSTGLCLREVRDREAYVGGLRGDMLFISEGNGSLLSRGVERDYVAGVSVLNPVGIAISKEIVMGTPSEEIGGVLEAPLYGGTKIISDGRYADKGVVLSWTRNDVDRERFLDFDLLAGGLRESLGNIGGEISRLPSILEGSEIRVGGNGLDASDWRGKLGGVEVVQTSGNVGEYEFKLGEKVVYSADGNVRFKEGEFEEGSEVYFVGVELGGDGFLGDGSLGEFSISPVPYVYERIYLRVGDEGHVGDDYISYFLNDDEARGFDLGEWGVALSLSSGLLLLGSGYSGYLMRYEGLLLGRSGELMSPQQVTNGGAVGAGNVFVTGVNDEGELDGLGYGSVFLSVGGVRLLPVVGGDRVRRSDRAYFGTDGKIRLTPSVERQGSVFRGGNGTLKLIQSMYPCRLWRKGLSQRDVSGFDWSIELSSGNVLSHVVGVGLSDDSLGVLTPSGHLMLLNKNDDIVTYNEDMGLAPRGLGTGVVLCLRGTSVNAFRELEDEIVVDRLRAGSTFTFLDFIPRVDFAGYEGRHFFKSLDLLKENEKLLYDFSDRGSPKLGWVESRVANRSLEEPSSFFELDAGIVLGSTSIKLIEGGVLSTLVEGVDYDLPNEAQSGIARRVYEFGRLKVSGFKSEYLGGDLMRVFTEEVISEGWYLVFDQDKLYRQVLSVSVGVGSVDLELSSVSEYDARGNEVSRFVVGESQGAWKLYEGQIDETSVDLMKLNDECFVEMPISDEPFMRVFKVYPATTGVAVQEVLTNYVSTNSKSYVRLDTGDDLPLVELSREVLEGRTVDLSSEHYVAGSYEIYVDGVKNENFTVDASTGELTFVPAIDDLSEVAFLPLPLSVADRVEILGDVLGSPSGVLGVLEEIDSEEYNVSTKALSISFKESLKEGIGVEVLYTPVSTGVEVRESILFIKNQELCVRVDEKTYTYSSGAYLEVTPSVFVNVTEEPSVVVSDGQITFSRSISEDEQVSISYARWGSLGGEFVVKVTEEITKPIVTINEGDTSVTLSGRSSLPELSIGDVIGMGNHHFLVSSIDGNTIGFSSPSRFNLRVDSATRTSRNDLFISVSTLASSQKKASEIFIQGDFRPYISQGTLIIVNDVEPYYVKNTSFLEEGVTQVSVLGYTSGFTVESFVISVRPVLSVGDVSLNPIGSIAVDLGVELVKFRNGLGLPLENAVGYLLSAETGSVTLKGSHIVDEGVKYILRYTAVVTTSPKYLADGTISYPKYNASYLVRTDASAYEGFPLLAKCVIETKDKFLLPVVNEDDYAVEVGAQLLQEVSSTTGKRSGSSPTTRPGISVGLFDQLGKDVIARNKINFYHALASYVDDWVSTTTGKVVGDQDGRFRFNLEQGGLFSVSEGLEDPITRVIKPRYAPLEYLLGEGIALSKKSTYNNLSSSTIKAIYDNQHLFVENELDDFVLTDVRTEQELFSWPVLSTVVKPTYNQMWKPHWFSRIYPYSGKFLTTLYPSDTPYSFPSTEGNIIGVIENPAREQIGGIFYLPKVQKRPARFRVLEFFPKGVSSQPSTVGKPTLLLSAVRYEDFPLNADGTPDTTQLIYEGNAGSPTIPSVETGDPALHFRGLTEGMVLELGRDGLGFDVLTLKNEPSVLDSSLFPTALISSAPKKVRVSSVIEGCYVVLEGKASTIEWFGSSFVDSPPKLGDTILESLQGDVEESTNLGTFYKVGNDIGLNTNTGELVDISLPSVNDPNFPLREIFEQNLPIPLLPIEGTVGARYSETTPFYFPALLGEDTNDDGDYTIPFFKQRGERDVLADLQGSISRLLRTEHSSQYVYPDEIAGLGSISSAKLTVDQSLTPYTEGEIASKNVERGDLVLIDLDDGATGFIEVSTVEGNSILPPRFKAPVSAGNIQYDLVNYFTPLFSTTSIGLRIGQIQYGGGYLTKFNLSSSNPTGRTLPTYQNLISFIESATAVGKMNSFDLAVLSVVFNFAYDGTDWWLYDGTGVHRVISLLPYGTTQSQAIFDYGFEFFSPTPIIDVLIWTNKFIPEGNVTVIDLATEQFTLDGATGIGEQYGITTLRFTQTTFHIVVGTPTSVDGGSQTATIEADRLTLKENANFDNQVAENSCSLTIGSCNILGNDSLINSTGQINGGLGFTNLEKYDSGFRVNAFEGHGNVPISKTDMKLSVMTASKVTEGATIYEGTSKTLNYDLGVIETGADDISNVNRGDLVFISEGHSSGTHRVLGSSYEDITEIEVVVVPPRISEMVDNGDGTYTLTMSEDLSDYFAPLPLVLFFTFNLENLKSAEVAIRNVAAFQVDVDSVSGATVVISGTPRLLDGSATPLSISDVIRVGADVLNFDRIPFDISASGAIDFLIDPQLSASELETTFGGGFTYALNIGLSNLSTGVGYLYMVNDAPPPALISVLLGDVITLTVDIKKGIYIDPTFPRMCHNYASGSPNYFGTATAYGLYDPSGAFSTESVTVSVRRLRRFSDLFLKLASAFDELNPIYEIRKGIVNTLVQSGNEFTLTPELVGRDGGAQATGRETQVGNFSEMISVGDKVHIYDDSNKLALKLKVINVANPLLCKYISGELPTGDMTFQIEVRNRQVPQEQIFEDFLRTAFTEILRSDQGEVITEALTDSDPTRDFTATQIEPNNGYYVVIDPAGKLDTDEYGAPPQGDTGKVGTTGYVVGTRSPFDDNRGAYKIIDVQPEYLEVESVKTEGSFAPDNYNLIPSVDGVEGNALANTAFAVHGTHDDPANSAFSIAPFSYRVLKRNPEVDESFADTMLFLRERTLSFMDSIKYFNEVQPISWETYESEGLVSEIGLEDKTYLTNSEILGLEGNVDQKPADVPFVTDSDCLSLLDRRFLLEDPRLSKEGYGISEFGLPNLLESGISFMEARDKRYSWINVRAGLLRGTLAVIDRVDFDNPNNNALEDINNE